MEFSCRHCGTSISYSGRGRPPVYCSRRCNELARTARRQQETRASFGDRRCRMCGSPIPDTLDKRARCCSVRCNVAFQNRKQRARKREAMLASRTPCKQCGSPIPAGRRAGSVYCSHACKKKANDAAWRLRSPHYNRQYLYGLSQERYEAMLAEQDNRCAICRTADWPGKDHRPHVDHDHKTGHFRGLLCDFCNRGLGVFGDDPARLRAAAGYLERAI